MRASRLASRRVVHAKYHRTKLPVSGGGGILANGTPNRNHMEVASFQLSRKRRLGRPGRRSPLIVNMMVRRSRRGGVASPPRPPERVEYLCRPTRRSCCDIAEVSHGVLKL